MVGGSKKNNKTNFFPAVVIITIALVIILLVYYSDSGLKVPDNCKEGKRELQKALDENNLAAIVNCESITVSSLTDDRDILGHDFANVALNTILKARIGPILMRQEAEELGLTLSDEAFEARIVAMFAAIEKTPEEYRQTLRDRGYSDDVIADSFYEMVIISELMAEIVPEYPGDNLFDKRRNFVETLEKKAQIIYYLEESE